MPLPATSDQKTYRGRIAPSPTGLLHLGHARTFWTAQERARAQGGMLIFRNDDLDAARCRPEFVAAMFEDLRWFGFMWAEGPDAGGPFGPYSQSERRAVYTSAFERLQASGFIYPCVCSRKDVLAAASAPHAGDEEPVYPGTCRSPVNPWEGLGGGVLHLNQPGHHQGASGYGVPPSGGGAWANTGILRTLELLENTNTPPAEAGTPNSGTTGPAALSGPKGAKINWRFRVPDGESITFIDGHCGPREYVAGRDFGDFVVWRHDDTPAYQLAVVVDDHAMGITEVARGADLLVSTARQLLLYRVLGYEPPQFYHCPLMLDEYGVRLAKRHDALSLRALRERGESPENLRRDW